MSSVDETLRQVLADRQAENAARYGVDTLKHGGGGGTSGGVTDDWKADVNQQLQQLHGDVRNLLYGLIGGFLLLAGMGFTLYSTLSEKVVTAQIAAEKSAGEAATRDAATGGKIDVLLERLPAKN